MFHACMYKRWRAGEIIFTNITMAFGISLPSSIQHNSISHLTSWSQIFLRSWPFWSQSRRRGIHRYPGVPYLLGAVLRGAAHCFLFIFCFQALFELFLLFAPVGDTTVQWRFIVLCSPCVLSTFRIKSNSSPGRKPSFYLVAEVEYQRASHRVNSILIPAMASRLMLSLKKAAVEPAGPWSLSTMSEPVGVTARERRTTRFTLRMPYGSYGASVTSTLSDTVDIELEYTPRLPRNRAGPSDFTPLPPTTRATLRRLVRHNNCVSFSAFSSGGPPPLSPRSGEGRFHRGFGRLPSGVCVAWWRGVKYRTLA